MLLAIIGIAFLVIIGLVISNTYRTRLHRTGQELSSSVKDAMTEFHSISNYGKHISEEEIEGYKLKYANLSEAIGKFRFRKFMTQQYFDSFNIGEFTVFFATIEKHCAESNRVYLEIQKLNEWCQKTIGEVDRLLEDDHYFSYSESKLFIQHNGFQARRFKELYPTNSEHFSCPQAKRLYDFIVNIEEHRCSHNQQFEKSQLSKYEEYFDNILEYSLDNQQREAIVCLEDNTLVISSAGSGKTSTIIGKARNSYP